jgi:hypothetical protein
MFFRSPQKETARMKTFAWSTAIAVAISLGINAHAARAATPDFFQRVTQPIGVAATPNEVLVTQPYCVNDNSTGVFSPSQWGIVKIDKSGSQAMFATLPADPNYGVSGTPGIMSNCVEPYIAIATGLFGNFAIGHVFVTEGGHVYEFDSSGNLVPKGLSNSLAFIPSLEVPFPHTSVVFDTVGTFGNRLLVAGTNISNQGEVWAVDSAGNTTKLATLTGPFAQGAACDGPLGIPCFEGPAVAPLLGPIVGTFPGWLFIAETGLSGISPDIALLAPGTSTFTFPNGSGIPSVPEHLNFVPGNPCSFNYAPNGASYQFFNASFAASGSGPLGNAIYAYRSSAFTGLAGQMLVVTEGGNPGISITTDATPTTVNYADFDKAVYNSEGSAFVQCQAVCDCNCPMGQPTPMSTPGHFGPPIGMGGMMGMGGMGVFSRD